MQFARLSTIQNRIRWLPALFLPSNRPQPRYQSTGCYINRTMFQVTLEKLTKMAYNRLGITVPFKQCGASVAKGEDSVNTTEKSRNAIVDQERKTMSNQNSVLVVGIGGITSSFKSTMSMKISRLINEEHPDVHLEIIHQDDYYLPQEKIPPAAPGLGHNYECPEAMRLDDCANDLQALIDRCVQSEKKTVILVEGIMLYCHKPLRDIFNQRYFLFGAYDEVKRIRSTRTDYFPPDVEGYFDAYVWPYAVKYEAQARDLAKQMSFHFLPMQDFDNNLASIMMGIRKWVDRDWILLTKNELQLQQIVRFVTEPSDGAVSVFCGVTRNTFEGKSVVHLEYEAYETMAYSQMRKLCNQLRSKWTRVDRIAMHHRLGVVPVTESSVIIAVSAPHRQEAQSACVSAIDDLKAHVPIWKTEICGDGSGTWKENSHGHQEHEHKN